MKKVEYTIRPIRRNEWDMAMQLAWDTFLIYEAPEYERLGIKNFHDFVKGRELKQLFILGEYEAVGAFEDDNVIIGVLGIRKKKHISLLFVEPKFHHQGIATALIEYARREITDRGYINMTVNSSPYAVQFYHKLGFIDDSNEVKSDGIRYTPMTKKLSV